MRKVAEKNSTIDTNIFMNNIIANNDISVLIMKMITTL